MRIEFPGHSDGSVRFLITEIRQPGESCIDSKLGRSILGELFQAAVPLSRITPPRAGATMRVAVCG